MLLALIGCGTDELPPLTDAKSLECPKAGDLPFRLETTGFVHGENATLAKNDPRVKDESSDTMGNPGGVVASVYLADSAMPTATPIAYRGAKARTSLTGGLFAMPLAGENVSLWTYDGTAWQTIGRTQTGDDGYYELPSTGFVAANGTPIYSMLEADGSCSEHYDYLLPAGTKVVVADIDGTLTSSDNEEFMQIGDETYTPVMMGAADKLTQTWAMKGYTVIYLTARPSVFRNETRNWLRDLMFSAGPLVTAPTVEDAAIYKTLWLKRMIDTFGWQVVAAYGNADTDIIAYNNAGIPKAQTFIVGPLAGNSGTVAIPNMDYTDHIATYVTAQPNQ